MLTSGVLQEELFVQTLMATVFLFLELHIRRFPEREGLVGFLKDDALKKVLLNAMESGDCRTFVGRS